MSLRGWVIDTWWPEWGPGRIRKIGKTRWRVTFPGPRVLVYDRPHLKFLRAANPTTTVSAGEVQK